MTEPRVEYRTQNGGDFTRVFRYNDGQQVGDSVVSGGRKIAERVARELNVAVASGAGLVLDRAYRGAVADAIREFDWGDYGLDDVGETLRDPGTQDWVDDLARAVAKALRGT